MHNRQTINFLGVQVDMIDTLGLRERVLNFALNGSRHKVMYVNTDCMLISLKDDAYRNILNRADLVYADGVGVVWGARLWGSHLPGRSTGADFMPEFCKVFAEHGVRIYLLGSKKGVAEQAAEQLLQKIPNLQIAGTHHGYFVNEDSNVIIDNINSARPHVLLLGLGVPFQEKWMEENTDKLNVPLVWGVGGLFDFVSGRTWRGPQWLLDHGFEWLCRLIAEPKRLWRRYIIGNSKFILYLFWYRFISQRAL